MKLAYIIAFLIIPVASAHIINSIHINEQGFEPKVMEIAIGETILFENTGKNAHWPASNNHPTHEIYPEFDPQKPINPGESWSFTFEKPGKWGFHDHLAPQFKGTITVKTNKRTFWQLLHDFWQGIAGFFAFGNEEKKENQPLGCTEFSCVRELMANTTAEQGPEKALKLLRELIEQKKINQVIDDHELAHEIGRTTAAIHGITPHAFFLCDTDFDYGCQHGFFEYALGKTNTSVEAIELICGQINESYSEHYKYRCYHGAGHGVMMAKAYDLNSTLAACDKLETHLAQDGCWQGAFMENTNAIMRGQARKGYFSETDPLVPCTSMQKKHQVECYYNQAPWLMKFHNYSVTNATTACLNAPADMQNICFRGLGLTLASPKWHNLIIPNYTPERFIESTVEVCKLFVEKGITECILGAVDNIMNFDETNITRAAQFCAIVDDKYRMPCIAEAGRHLSYQVTSKETILEQCDTLGEPFKTHCLIGAGLA